MSKALQFFIKPALFLTILFCFGCSENASDVTDGNSNLRVVQDEAAGTISIFRENGSEPILVQNCRPDHRPYLHPIMAPDGNGELTEYSPGHHKHQTGLYWGFTRVNGEHLPPDTLAKWEEELGKWWFYKPDKPANVKNKVGRDFFHNPGGDYWQLVSATVTADSGASVKWQTVYNMLDADGNTIMTETQKWTMQEEDGKFLVDLEWVGDAKEDVSINEFEYGGMFLRMPWRDDIAAGAINAARQRNNAAEGQRAMWVDVGMDIEGRDDQGHIAIFDHSGNAGFPQPWRVDGQLGIGPARSISGDWVIKKGQPEIIRHRIVAYTGDLNDLELTKLWTKYVDGHKMYSTAALWDIAQEEGYKEKFLEPAEAAEAMTMKEGYQVNAWASEPMITQPMAFCWDDRGRMWIAENRDYETRGTGFSNSGDSKILILEDTDGDGIADSRKVFLEGIPFPAAIAVGFDGLFLGAPPNLLFVPDRDGDDKADMEDIEIRLTGWGIRDRHETINSLHWGPDGWLYGCEGFATPSKIRKPNENDRIYKHKDKFPEILEGSKSNIFSGAYWDKGEWKEQEGVDFNGGVFRYHPTKDRFEVVAHGFSNPWGIDYDAKGQLFISACVIPHLFHVIPGGYYHRQGGQHFNSHVYSDIQTIVNHRHRSAHGGARVYQSDAFSAEEHGRVFMANIHEHAVLSDVLERKGSGFVAHHGDEFLMANNAQWVGFSMEVGPEGGLYVLDWHDADICGSKVIHKDTGRIFRVTPENSLAENWDGRYSDLKKMNDVQLAELQTSKSDWHSRRARVILQSRASAGSLDQAAVDKLKEIYSSNDNADYRMKGMWALHITGNLSEADLTAALSDRDEYVRAWAVQFLCEDETPAAPVVEKFAQMANNDDSPVVRLYLSAALMRIDKDARWDIASGLMKNDEDLDDHNIPLMLWFGFEPLAGEDPARALELAVNSEIPQISEFTARRAIDANETEILVEWLGKRTNARLHMLKGMRDGLEGRTDLSAPSNWSAVYDQLKKDKNLAELATSVAQQFGDVEAAGQYLATLQDANAPIADRRTALNGLANQQLPQLKEMLPELLNDPDLRIDAIRAVASYEDWRLGKMILEQYETYTADEKLEAVQTMASRPVYGEFIMWALKEGAIPKQDVPSYVAKQLRRVVGSGFMEVWGPLDQLSTEKAAAYDKYKAMLTDEALSSANLANGRTVFRGKCGACHKLYEEGGNLGPDITGSNRSNLDYLLENIIDPSGDIQDDYKMVVVTTRDGRTYVGNIVGENNRQVRLRVVGQEAAVVLNKSNIQSQETTPSSMMPEGILSQLTEKEVIDLVAYLRTTVQIDL